MALKDLLKNVAKRKVEAYNLAGKLDHAILRGEMKPSQRRTDCWHPSQIVDGICARQAVLLHRLPPEQIVPEVEGELYDAKTYRIFDTGHAMHAWYQERYLGPSGLLWGFWRCSRCHHEVKGTMPQDSCPRCQWTGEIDSETVNLTAHACEKFCSFDGYMPGVDISHRTQRSDEKVKARGGCVHCRAWGHWEFREPPASIPHLNVHGHGDGALVDEPFSDKPPETLVELKTSGRGFYGLMDAMMKHKKQVMVYLHAMKLKRAVILYIDKQNSDLKEFEMEYDRTLIADVLEDIADAETCKKDATLPTPPRKCCKTPKDGARRGCRVITPCFADVTT